MRSETDLQDDFADELTRLKREGASVLIVGSVRDDHRRNVSRRLFGTNSTDRRRILVSTTGTGTDLERQVGAVVPASSSAPLVVITYEASARSVATQSPSGGPPPVESTPTTHPDHIEPTRASDLGDVGLAVSEAIEQFDRDANGLNPSAVRIGVDSLLPLLETAGRETVFTLIHLINHRAKTASGMVHYHLPVAPSTRDVSVFRPLCDLIVELRDRNGVPMERWTTISGDATSGWIRPPNDG